MRLWFRISSQYLIKQQSVTTTLDTTANTTTQ